jgi:hypothetical protein
MSLKVTHKAGNKTTSNDDPAERFAGWLNWCSSPQTELSILLISAIVAMITMGIFAEYRSRFGQANSQKANVSNPAQKSALARHSAGHNN